MNAENSGTSAGGAGIYVAFGRSLGNMSNMQMMPTSQGGGQSQRGQRPEMGSRPEGGQNSKSSEPNWIDVHGAGSQRSDPKSGDPSIYANGHGPQGDVIRINNYVRLVRDL